MSYVGGVASSSSWALEQLRWLRGSALADLALTLLADVAVWWLEAAAMSEVPISAAAPAAYSMFSATHFGAG